MKLIKPEFKIIEPTGYTIDDIYKSIELAGRVSHKSEDKITETSAKDFVGRMLNMKHLATCEFGTVYLYVHSMYELDVKKYRQNPYSKAVWSNNGHYISTNYRTLVENNWLDDLKYLCEPTEHHHKRYTVKYICDRAIANEIVRHRKFSFLQESTRYCRYSADKFNGEITYIKPCWCDNIKEGKFETYDGLTQEEGCFIHSLLTAEAQYLYLVNSGWKAEQARDILPLALKTELYMCGYVEDWEKFFELRSKKYGVGNPHPQADELATPLYEEFIKRGYINE